MVAKPTVSPVSSKISVVFRILNTRFDYNSPGGYRFGDFFRVGIWLILIVGVVGIMTTCWLYDINQVATQG